MYPHGEKESDATEDTMPWLHSYAISNWTVSKGSAFYSPRSGWQRALAWRQHSTQSNSPRYGRTVFSLFKYFIIWSTMVNLDF